MHNPPIHWQCLPFQQLTTHQLYEIIHLRLQVFCVEQQCYYQDADHRDYHAHHLVGYNPQGTLVAYARILPVQVSYPHDVSIGRVVTAPAARKQGIGQTLMTQALHHCQQLFGNTSIRISAQSYLLRFYQSFGFQPVGEPYLEDDIPHTQMLYTYPNS